MSAPPKLEGLEPAAEAGAQIPPLSRPRAIGSGIRVNIRGRSVRLRRLKREPSGLLRWLVVLGPGLIAASAGNDAGGIATYSQAGAKYGYELIWVMVLITVSLGVLQELSARLGAATGRGMLDLIRERFGLGWALFGVGVTLIANGGLIVSEFVGIGAAFELFGMSRMLMVPAAALLVWYLIVFSSYGRVEKVFLFISLVFFAYPIAAFRAGPDWGAVLHGAVVPTLHADSDYLLFVVGLIGTTITPFMLLFQQSSTVERGAARRHYGPERVDAYAGSIFSNLMSIAMMIATAATLHAAGATELATATDAARALEPVAGAAAKALFGVGLLGASLLAAGVLPLATSYTISEAFGFPKGVDLDFRRARTFFTLFTALLAIGAGIAMIPGIPVIKWLVGVQVLNGALLPVMLVFTLRLANDSRLMGELKNSRLQNVIGWTTFAIVTLAVTAMFATQLLEALGIDLFA